MNALFKGGRWPDPVEELLLKASLGETAECKLHFERWTAMVNLDTLNVESQRLLPLLYQNLRRFQIEHPAMGRMKGVYRYCSAKNQLLLSELKKIVVLFAEHGIETMLLKGAALATYYYASPALRPMSDCDLLIRPEQLQQAIEILGRAGYAPWKRLPQHLHLFGFHAFLFYLPNGTQLDLHWYAFSENKAPGTDDALWDHAKTMKFGEVDARILSPADLLFHVAVHGTRWSAVPAVRWVADSMFVLKRSKEELDWDLLCHEARRRRLTLPLSRALRYLSDTYGAAVPLQTLNILEHQKRSFLESFDYRIRSLRESTLSEMQRVWCDHCRLNSDYTFWQLIRRFPAYLRDKWGLEKTMDVPFYLFRRRLKKLQAWHRIRRETAFNRETS